MRLQQFAHGVVDALIATTSQDNNAQVLHGLCNTLYQPNLVTLAALLQPLLQADFTQIREILYLAQTDMPIIACYKILPSKIR